MTESNGRKKMILRKGDKIFVEAEYIGEYEIEGEPVDGAHIINVRAFPDGIYDGIKLMVTEPVMHINNQGDL
jgi:hypothetical protein